MVAASAGRLRSARSVRSSTCALTRRRRRRCPRRGDPTNQSCECQHQCIARDDRKAFCESVARWIEGRRRQTDGFDEDVTDSHERAVQKAPIFGHFSREERAEGKKKPIREAYADRRVRERCQTRNQKKRRLSSSLGQP